jgi:1,4-dihydroxy-2-naphthoate octaprenyltransferase
MVDETAPAAEPVPASEWEKYFRPKSVTWWASVTPLILGLVLALAQTLGWAPVISLIDIFAPGASPAMLVNLGLFGIGLRGALK